MTVSFRADTPSPVLVDDSLLTYSGNWEAAGTGNEYNGTTHGTSTPGSIATFQFSGTSVSVFGTVGLNNLLDNPVSSYTVDGANAATYNGPVATQVAYHQVFYQSPTLKDGPHTLSIQLVSFSPSPNVTTGDPLLWIDYVVYTPSESVGPGSSASDNTSSSSSTSLSAPTIAPSSSKPTSSSGPPTSSSPSGSAPSTSASTGSSGSGASTVSSASWASMGSSSPGGSSSTSTASNLLVPIESAGGASQVASSSSRSQVGAIVGGVVGAVVAIFLIAVCLFMFLRKRRRVTPTRILVDLDDDSPPPEPITRVTAYTYTSIPPASPDPEHMNQSRDIEMRNNPNLDGLSTVAAVSRYDVPASQKSVSGLPVYATARGTDDGGRFLPHSGSLMGIDHEDQPPAYES